MVFALASQLRGPGSTHGWVNLVVGSLFCSERFFSGFSGFPLSSKINISKFQFYRMQDLPANHFRVSGASCVNINNYWHFLIDFWGSMVGAVVKALAFLAALVRFIDAIRAFFER